MTDRARAAAGIRTPPLPIEHLDAELLAAPFASDSAFAGALAALDPRLDPKRSQTTIALWRQTERDLLARFPGMSVDELVIRRDRAWFGRPTPQPCQEIPLGELLRAAARDLIDPHGGIARPLVTSDRREADQRHSWRWLTFALPADLLLAAAGASSETLDTVSARLRAQLADGGFAEPHLHLKAAMGFPTLWASLMCALARPAAKSSMLEGPGAEWDEGRGLAPLLLTCALARLLLAAFLSDPVFQTLGLQRFLDERAGPGLHRRFGATACFPLWQSLLGLAAGRAPDAKPFPGLRGLYAQLIGPEQRGRPITDLDPVGWWFAASPAAHPDFGLTRAALDYLDGPGARDAPFARVFWQTQRGRVLFYRHVVQRPMVSGLQWFSRTYARLGKPRKPIVLGEFVRQAVKLAGPGLRSLEVRVTPEKSLHELVDLIGKVDQAGQALGTALIISPPKTARAIRDYERKALFCEGPAASRLNEVGGIVIKALGTKIRALLTGQAPYPELGLVIHFSRSRGDSAEQGRPAAWSCGGHGDPADSTLNPSGYRYSGYYREQRIGAMALANLLSAYPRMLERVRGIDLCTDELAIPLWVLRPLVRHVLQAGERAAAQLYRADGERAPGPLRVTVHAGEDFVHLMGGIRRVDESVALLGLGEGSRIGHAVSLGIDVREWAARAGRLVVPRGERLLDLLWARRVALRVPEDLRSWLPWIDREVVRLGAEVFNRTLAPELLELWWGCLHDVAGLRAAGFPDGPRPRPRGDGDDHGHGDPSVADLVYRWLTDRALFQRAQALESIEVGREVPLVIALQAHVRGVIGSRGIAIEINPSSNLLIGHLGDLASHPLWRLCPPPGIVTDAPVVRVCIGSDDPITFATCLPEEYQLLADALAGAGVAGPDADAWLDAARQCGLATRFTIQRSGTELMSPMRAGMLPPPL